MQLCSSGFCKKERSVWLKCGSSGCSGDSVVSGGQVGATRRAMSMPNDAVSGIKFALE